VDRLDAAVVEADSTAAGAPSRVRVLGHQPYADYLRLCRAADVVLDTFPFGGGNSHYEALATHAAVVTLATRQMRGRITYALYHRMGMVGPVHGVAAESVAQYIDMAVALGTDPVHNRATRATIAERVGVLYEDTTGIDELADWLVDVTKGAA
jgi:protein O-GlcNAc transferase